MRVFRIQFQMDGGRYATFGAASTICEALSIINRHFKDAVKTRVLNTLTGETWDYIRDVR